MNVYIKRPRNATDSVTINGIEFDVVDAIRRYIEKNNNNAILYAQTGETAGYISEYDHERGFYVSLIKRIDDQYLLANECYRIKLVSVSNIDTPTLDILYSILVFEEEEKPPKIEESIEEG